MRAIALISGGLDSILAAKIIQDEGIEVIPLNFKIPFYKSYDKAAWASKYLNTEFKTIDISADYLEIIQNPEYGFGSNMNPCIDCKILMLNRAKLLMQELDAKFIVTGEVLGQRPMSQNRRVLGIISKSSGLEGLVLRPLCAKLLPESMPEKEGWVSRDKLLDFNGRSRKPQIELAKKLGIKDYPTPAGGCLLTDPEFSKRLKELISHNELDISNIELLKIGRHFRISSNTKLIVGRNQQENEGLVELSKKDDYIFMPQNIAGPTALGRGRFSQDLIKLSCSITCRYSDLDGTKTCKITYGRISTKDKNILEISSLPEQNLIDLRI